MKSAISSLCFWMMVACSSQSAPSDTAVIVGIQSEQLSGTIDTIHVVTDVDGKPSTDDILPIVALPHEVRLAAPGGNPAAAIRVRVDGLESSTSPVALLSRTAETKFAPGRTMLLRLLLQSQCVLRVPSGPTSAPSCNVPQTCVSGVCQDDHVTPLEAYLPNWATNTVDICKPSGAGAPIVQLGAGQVDYLPLTMGQTIQAEQGPQGGHHVWIAVRQQNLKQLGSTTTISSVQPSTGLTGPGTSFAFAFDSDQGGFCKIAGLRYQLDADGTDYHRFLGQPLDVTVTITDRDGTTGSDVAHINIASTILCPSGISGC